VYTMDICPILCCYNTTV